MRSAPGDFFYRGIVHYRGTSWSDPGCLQEWSQGSLAIAPGVTLGAGRALSRPVQGTDRGAAQEPVQVAAWQAR